MQRVVSLLSQCEGRQAHTLEAGLDVLDPRVGPASRQASETATSGRARQQGEQVGKLSLGVRGQRANQGINPIKQPVQRGRLTLGLARQGAIKDRHAQRTEDGATLSS